MENGPFNLITEDIWQDAQVVSVTVLEIMVSCMLQTPQHQQTLNGPLEMFDDLSLLNLT